MVIIVKKIRKFVWYVTYFVSVCALSTMSLGDSNDIVVGGPAWRWTQSHIFSLISRDFSKNFQTNVEEVFVEANS